jgi:ubiquinone/menaquinone biosynthesis C-methylase UbiE
VLAIDANSKMVSLARMRLGDKAEVRQANIELPLDFLSDASFDIVICPLVMDYVQDWQSAFCEFHRILAPGGCLVFSIEHPHTKFEDHRETSNYFAVELVEYTWRGFGKPVTVPSYRRSLSEVINPLLTSGFALEQILEPLPLEEFKEIDPEDYEQLIRSPGFLCVKALKR